MQYYVYILYSDSTRKFYIGMTVDVENRLKEHNRGESQFTSSGIPWALIWCFNKDGWRSAELLEFKLKNLSRQRKIKFMWKYPEGITDLDLLQRLS